MDRFERLFGILLYLRSKGTISAPDLARRFEVSVRTIYRDVESLSALGVPVYAERGRDGGFRLLDGYFLPPLTFTRGEAVSLLLGLTLLRSLRARPFAAESESAERKLLAAVPERLQAILANAPSLVGFERIVGDAFHPEPAGETPADPGAAADAEGATVGEFLQAILDGATVHLRYRSPYSDADREVSATPLGVLWDRDRWYLVGTPAGRSDAHRLWRADRVLAIRGGPPADGRPTGFDVRDLLGHAWLGRAMAEWRERCPVVVRLTHAQAERLRADWYYRHALSEPDGSGRVVVSFGESDRAKVLDLLRWLGPGAELVEPRAWRADLRADLRALLAAHEDGDSG